MKKTLLLIISGLFLALVVSAQVPFPKTATTAASPKEEILVLKETGYSFGKIPQGRPVIHVFEIVN
ncbi:MAG TPA: hypothetical protein VK622_11230, partial [Puia sp.]|nr:hypothetical protein [Puia sp.]